MKKLLITTLLLVGLMATAQAEIAVCFGTTNTLSSWLTWGTSADTVLANTYMSNDTVRSTIPYGTLETTGVNTYEGPTINGALYMNAVYSTNQTATFQSTWATLRYDTTSLYMYLRRNGEGGASNESVTRGLFNFETEGSYKLDANSEFSVQGTINRGTTTNSRWSVVNDGNIYLSESLIAFDENASTTTYTLTDPASVNWAAWVPGDDIAFSPGTFDTPGSSLKNITQAGYYFEKIQHTSFNPVLRTFILDATPAQSSGTVLFIR